MLHAKADLSGLRDAMNRIEGLGVAPHRGPKGGAAASTGWSGACGASRVPLGAEPLDRLLGGGLRPGSLHEVVAESARDEAAASGFAASVAGLVTRGRTLVWVLDDRVAWEVGTPYRPGLAAHGLDPDRLILVKTRDAATTLWATEEALKAGAPAVLTELWRAGSYDLAASRRLLLAARSRGATSLVVHVGLRQGESLSSGAETRFAVAAAPSLFVAAAGPGLAIPGPASVAVRLVKRRGGPDAPVGAYDRDQVHHLAWDRAGRRFGHAERSRGRPPFGPPAAPQPATVSHFAAAQGSAA
jgi:protein ImuA